MINDTKPFLYNYLHLIVGNAGFAIISFINLFLMVRILSPAGYGSYVLFISVASSIAVLTLWTSSSIVRFGREEFATEGSVKKTFWANYGILLPAFVFCLLLVFLFRVRLSDYIGISQNACLLLFVYILFSNLVSSVPIAFQAMGKIKHFSYLSLIFSGSFLVVLIVIYLKSLPVSIEMVIALLIFANLLAVAIGLWLLRKDIIPICFSKDWIKRCFSYSWPYTFGGVSQIVSQNFGQIVIGLFMTGSFVGIYNVAFLLQGYLIMIPMLSIGLMFPLMTSLVVTGEKTRIERYSRVYAPQIGFFWALFISVFLLFAPEIFLLFGPDYVAASLPFAILLVGITFRIFTTINSPILVSYGLTKHAVSVSIVMGAILLGLYFLLIPKLGISGAAIASTVVFIFGAVAYSFILLKWLRINDYRNYLWVFPAIIAFVGFILIDSLLLRLLFLVVMMAISLLVAKKSAVFNLESLAILDSIDMPFSVRRTIRQVYSVLL